ncbi:MAG TPA: class I SAM-dependent methyltransferase [Pirellulaceae bacterium]|nr:class I SAM-dependent methyltransferase [Pirellulaceae bacterium]
MVSVASQPALARRKPDVRTVVRCYSLFDKFFPACGLLDYTEGIYHNDPTTPYEEAQQNQIDYVLNEAGCMAGTRILEIGCGNGNLLESARRRRAKAVGITVSPEQVALCRQRGLDARLKNYVDLDDRYFKQFDAVIANGPIEHFVQPAEAAAGRTDEIYREFFDICHRAIDPFSTVRRMITTTIHFVRPPDPHDLLKSPFRFRWGSDQFHYAMLARAFGGWYPESGQFQRCNEGLFRLLHTVDGTYDYHLTSEEWLRRIRRVLPTKKGLQILASTIPYALRHPVQYATMLTCMLGSQSWNWQFRGGKSAPTRLLRQTWGYRY